MTPTKSMTLRLARDQADDLEALAQIEDRPIADIVREAISNHVEARKRDPRFQKQLRASLDRNRRILKRLSKT